MMQRFTIYHNPRCSKSSAALALLDEHGITPLLRDYIGSPLSAAELSTLLAQLDLPVLALIRTQEVRFTEQCLSAESDDASLHAALLAAPELMQRPIVSDGKRAVIARPPELALTLLTAAVPA